MSQTKPSPSTVFLPLNLSDSSINDVDDISRKLLKLEDGSLDEGRSSSVLTTGTNADSVVFIPKPVYIPERKSTKVFVIHKQDGEDEGAGVGGVTGSASGSGEKKTQLCSPSPTKSHPDQRTQKGTSNTIRTDCVSKPGKGGVGAFHSRSRSGRGSVFFIPQSPEQSLALRTGAPDTNNTSIPSFRLPQHTEDAAETNTIENDADGSAEHARKVAAAQERRRSRSRSLSVNGIPAITFVKKKKKRKKKKGRKIKATELSDTPTTKYNNDGNKMAASPSQYSIHKYNKKHVIRGSITQSSIPEEDIKWEALSDDEDDRGGTERLHQSMQSATMAAQQLEMMDTAMIRSYRIKDSLVLGTCMNTHEPACERLRGHECTFFCIIMMWCCVYIHTCIHVRVYACVCANACTRACVKRERDIFRERESATWCEGQTGCCLRAKQGTHAYTHTHTHRHAS